MQIHTFITLFCLLGTHAIADTESTQPSRMVVFDALSGIGTSDWEVEDDGVMGGLSQGQMDLQEGEPLIFSGDVSLENNGGFSSIQYSFEPISLKGHHYALLRIKGDGKRYQFRVESGGERHAYIYQFETSGSWETVVVPLNEMYPSFHGNRLDRPNYPAEQLAQIRFLIGNNRAESFRLEVESVVFSPHPRPSPSD